MDLLCTVEVIIPQCRHLSIKKYNIIYLLSKPYLLIIDSFLWNLKREEQTVNTTLILSYCKADMPNVLACTSIFEYFRGYVTGHPKYVNDKFSLYSVSN